MMSYWSELTRPAVTPRAGTPTVVVGATRVDPPYVTDEVIASLHAALGVNLTVLHWDCEHMVPSARPAETAEVIRAQLG